MHFLEAYEAICLFVHFWLGRDSLYSYNQKEGGCWWNYHEVQSMLYFPTKNTHMSLLAPRMMIFLFVLVSP